MGTTYCLSGCSGITPSIIAKNCRFRNYFRETAPTGPTTWWFPRQAPAIMAGPR
jgi:hypothetical protein